MATISKDTQAALLSLAADAAKPYNSLAQTIGTQFTVAKAASEKATAERTSVWSLFRDALSVAAEAGHSASQLRVGMETACLSANIPAGSFRS